MNGSVHFQSSLTAPEQTAWRLFLDQTPRSHPTQTLDWGCFLQELGYRLHYFFAEDAGRWTMLSLCAARPIPGTRKYFFELTRGPVAADPDFARELLPALVDTLRRHRAAAVRIKPVWAGAAADGLSQTLAAAGWQPRFDESHHTLEIDLHPDTDAILSQFKSAVRYEIRRAGKVGVETRAADTDAEFEEWFALYVRMCAAKGVSLPNHRFHHAQWDRWLKCHEHGVLILARYQDRLVAGSVVMRDRHRCVYFYGASTERIPGVPLGEPLQWHAIQWAKQHGCAVYDLGGFHPGEPKGTAQYHVDRFKLGFARQPVAYLPAHELVLDPVAYAVWKTAKRVAPKVRSLLRGSRR